MRLIPGTTHDSIAILGVTKVSIGNKGGMKLIVGAKKVVGVREGIIVHIIGVLPSSIEMMEITRNHITERETTGIAAECVTESRDYRY